MNTPFNPFDHETPRWFTIPAHRPFLEDLAAGVLHWLGTQAPETLSDATLLLPNRRAARAFTSALSRLSGDRPVLLPQVRPLGDLEEDEPPFTPGELGLDLPPAIAPLTRRFEMARMIVEEFAPGLGPMRALEMADSLGAFLDSCHIEEVEDPGRIATLVEADFAEHWQASAEFLGLAVEAWPKRLALMGLVDASWRRTRLLRLLAERWAAHPPQGPVIAAGSTGTVKAAADVLRAVANAPLGCVVLPGLDQGLGEDAWGAIDEQHPQSALKRLLVRAGVERAAVRPWFRPPVDTTSEARGLARQRLVNEALRPADATADWRAEIRDLRRRSAEAGVAADPIALGLEGLSLVTARTEEDAAQTIALMMRETLETPGQTCALVTPDLALGRRVAARLERWGVVADSSSGTGLDQMPVGVLVDLAARWMADPLKPQTILGLIKHALTTLAEATPAAVMQLEAVAFRGPRTRDWTRIERRLTEASAPRRDGRVPSEAMAARLAAATALAGRLQGLCAEVGAGFDPMAALDDAARALTGLVEALAGVEVWAGPDGEAAASLLSQLIEGGASLGAVSPGEFAELVSGLLHDTTVRTGGATHPSLRILGAIEARLVRADRMILAGLEEGVWPQGAPIDPFLSRPMRKDLGLPPPERRVGQTAQDFVQAACAPEAILIHTERRGGQPAVRSRWLWRLEMLTNGAGVTIDRPTGALDAARALDAPAPGPLRLAKRPAPTPPVERRPRQLPVTGVERWVRDPYAVYARYVLNLKPMDRPGQSAEALLRGSAIHKAVERLTLSWPDVLPEDCEDQIVHLLHEELRHHGFEDAAMARESPLARNAARWLAGFEMRRRAKGIEIRVEEEVTMTFDAEAGPFTLTAKADRIELSSTGAAILDFKTGAAPSAKQVRSGFAPQLTLTGAILAEAGLKGSGPVEPEELTYVRVVGRKVPGEAAVRAEGSEAADLSMAALAGLKARVARFDVQTTPYLSWVAPQFMGNYGGNYDHLARVWEWHVAGAEEAEA
ncbi:double-strand break repair protein AddB [Brevundimonas sp. LM2]|uniref:double-strand break repair protein AddB n=1 Tax=Brevundimonas sp. LM2 TaxID=1938605 RepID=UPI000983EABA|nr:double-strand break repair protein AddB [Brevundimonas sp. LM2]AQR61036.1 double-strand break repair protein AddB [Brevundimonas sp. LM2]